MKMQNITTRVKIEHPENLKDDYQIKAHVIPPGTNWENVPSLDEMINQDIDGVLLSLDQFAAICLFD